MHNNNIYIYIYIYIYVCIYIQEQEEKMQRIDKRTIQRHFEIAVCTGLNKYHFSVFETMVPNSEGHIYLVPNLAKYVAGTCLFSENKIKGLYIKHDGLLSGKNLGIKTGYATIQMFDKIINNYNIDQLSKNFKVCNMY